jgi:hypothetical protein
VQKVADDAQNVDFYQRVLTLWYMFFLIENLFLLNAEKYVAG